MPKKFAPLQDSRWTTPPASLRAGQSPAPTHDKKTLLTPCNLSLRSQCTHWLWQSAPQKKAPLRKGSWHGEAVTEGSLPPRPLFHKCLRRGTFCQQRQKVPKERRQNQWFWNPCAGVARNVSGPFIPANKVVQTRPVLSHCLGVYPPRRAPRLCCPSKQRYPLRLPCGAMWASRPTKLYR